MSLTAKQEEFVRQYLVDFNASAAYRRAGYSVKSADVAKAAASRLLANVNVAEAVRVALEERAEKAALTVDEVIEGFRQEYRYKGEGSSQSARVSALAWLGKYLGMFVERHEHSFTDDDADRALRAELERLAAARTGKGADALPHGRGPGGDARPGENGA